jgi:hypothetical protein
MSQGHGYVLVRFGRRLGVVLDLCPCGGTARTHAAARAAYRYRIASLRALKVSKVSTAVEDAVYSVITAIGVGKHWTSAGEKFPDARGQIVSKGREHPREPVFYVGTTRTLKSPR